MADTALEKLRRKLASADARVDACTDPAKRPHIAKNAANLRAQLEKLEGGATAAAEGSGVTAAGADDGQSRQGRRRRKRKLAAEGGSDTKQPRAACTTASSGGAAPAVPNSVDVGRAVDAAAPTVPLCVHFAAHVDVMWPEMRPLLEASLAGSGNPSGAPIGRDRIRITCGDDTAPTESHVYIGKPSGLDGFKLCSGGSDSSLRAVVLPFAGVPPIVKETMVTLQKQQEADFPRLYNLHHNAPPTAELAIALLLATSRRLVAADTALRAGSWRGKHCGASGARTCGLGTGVCLIIGYGTVGKRVAAVCQALGMRVLATSRTAPPYKPKKTFAEMMASYPRGANVSRGGSGELISPPPPEVEIHPATELPALLKQATHVVLACPLTAMTRGILGAAELALLPPGAVVVNVGRGELIDEAAMWAALNEDGGRRLAFGSDVWWQEPKTAPPHPSAGPEAVAAEEVTYPSPAYPFHTLDNVVCTPHMAGAKGLPGVEAARVNALWEILSPILFGEAHMPFRALC